MYQQFAQQLNKRHSRRSVTAWLNCLDVEQDFAPKDDQLELIREDGYDVISFSAEGEECFWNAVQVVFGLPSKGAAMAALKAAVKKITSEDAAHACCVKAMKAALNDGDDIRPQDRRDLHKVKSAFLARVGEKGEWGGGNEFHVLGCASDSPCAATQLYSFGLNTKELEYHGVLQPVNAGQHNRTAHDRF